MTSPYGTIALKKPVLPACAKATFLAARSLAQCKVVAASVARVDGLLPIPVGPALRLRAKVHRAGRSPMAVCVAGLANAPGAARKDVLKGVFDMGAVDGRGRPTAMEHRDLNQETSA
ncbi:MAG: acyl-CoA thioesterase [Burkholderiaceae bacterium]|nr:acyl-CoA thioesterase [Burkholderiaceae bacterium]